MPYLDGLRGIAVLYVVVSHYSLFEQKAYAAVGPIGHYGVYLFFLLSSFLLTGLFVRSLRRRSFGREILIYAKRRVLRIYPMFSVTLIALALIPSFNRMMFAGNEFSYLDQFFLLNAGGNYWALGVEFEFYFLLPLFPIAFVLARHPYLKLGVAAVVATLVALQWHWNYFAAPPNYPHVPAYIYLFLMGQALALVNIMIEDGDLPKPPRALALLLFSAGLVGELYLIPGIGKDMIAPLIGAEASFRALASDGNVTALWALMLFGILYSGDEVQRALSFGWLRHIGVVSYSIYLTHIFVLSQFAQLQPSLSIMPILLLSLLGTLMLSTLTYLLVERPFMRLR
jgi:peptidoglycan/LPS O-acetylase OafA/YrhL